MKQHPLSAAFPSMSSHSIDDLADSIKTIGQQNPIIVHDGMVLDGWHRYQACQIAKVLPIIEEFDGDDPVAFVLGANLHRRHLTESQRAAAVVMCSEWAKSGGQVCTRAALTSAQMAETAQVSERTIVNAKRGIEAGLGEAIKDGKISARAAAEVGREPQTKREIEHPTTPDFSDQLAQMQEEMASMQAELMALRAGSSDPELVAQARDEIEALREALADEQRAHAVTKKQRQEDLRQLNELKRASRRK